MYTSVVTVTETGTEPDRGEYSKPNRTETAVFFAA